MSLGALWAGGPLPSGALARRAQSTGRERPTGPCRQAASAFLG